MFASWLLVSSIVYADSLAEEEAELVRIVEDMQKFRKRGNWTAVEKKYEEALGYKKATIPYEIHLIAAESISSFGNFAETKVRLERAAAVEQSSEVTDWLSNINSNFGSVKIRVSSSFERPPELIIAEVPFFPEHQQALAFAKKELQEKGTFSGMLPIGEYTIGPKAFTVQQGQDVENINVSQSLSLAYIGPRFDVGASVGRAGESSAQQMEANPFGGGGTRIGVGLDIGLSERVGVVTEVGYHAMLSGGDEPSAEQVLNYGLEGAPTQYHGAFGWLAGSYQLGSIRLLAGPTMEMARVQTQGVSAKSTSVSQENLAFTPVQGSIVACGGSGGLTYYGFEMGQKWNGGVSALVGAHSDSARWYSWGQIAFTMNGRN